jgi:glycosyltransferase involved in cell wall biosynthesis
MACGCPVVVSTAGSLPEIAGPAALLVEPRDERALADAIRTLILDPPSDLIERGLAHAARFSYWRLWRTAYVGDGGPRGGEREPPARALRAAADGPCGGRAAALAARRFQPRQRAEARVADLRTAPPAGETALRQQQLEHPPTLLRRRA